MPIALGGVPLRTEDMLDFIVIGGGIAGLATAWSLRRAGHQVTVFEQQRAAAMAKCRESMRSTPTMTLIMDEWGVGDVFSSVSTQIVQMTFLDGKTGEELGLIAVNGKVRESLPADLYCVQYGELFCIFYDLAQQSGVNLHFERKVVSVDPWQGSVVCEDGLQLVADVIVGADGTESIVRPVVLGSAVPAPDYDKQFTVSLVVPADVARQDEELAPLVDAGSLTGWFGDDCSMCGVLAGPGPNRDYSLGLNITINSEDACDESPMGLESLRVESFEPRAQKLLKLADQLRKVVFANYEPFDSWVHDSGRVVLVGEAAHPIIPLGSHSASTCIEDAMTLSMLFSLPATKSQTTMLLNVFEELRQPRCATVQRYVRRKRDIITLPHGPAQRKRDALLRSQRVCHSGDEMDDEFLCNTYSGFVQVYGFNAREAVEDWWVKWGRSLFVCSPDSKSEGEEEPDDEDVPTSLPVVVDAEVERIGPAYPIISDPLMGEDEDLLREAEADRRHRQSPRCLPVLRLRSDSFVAVQDSMQVTTIVS